MARSIKFSDDTFLDVNGVFFGGNQYASDLNDKYSGLFFIDQSSLNRPTSITYGALFAFDSHSGSSEYYFQIVFNVISANTICIRSSIGKNAWGAWKIITPT